MKERTIEEKLNLYSNTYVKGECRSNEYETRIKQEKTLNKRLDLADTIFNEITYSDSTLYIHPGQKKQVKELIQIYSKDFTQLYRKRESDEKIILALIFYIKKQEDNSIQIQKYNVTKKYGLSHTIFETVLCNLIANYLKEVYIIPRPTKEKNHDILAKGQ